MDIGIFFVIFSIWILALDHLHLEDLLAYYIYIFPLGVWQADNLMEGLVSSQIITPVHVHYKQQHSLFIPTFSLQLRKNWCRSQVRMLKHPRSFNPVAASVKPLEASTLGRFNNTSPSKGYHLFLMKL